MTRQKLHLLLFLLLCSCIAFAQERTITGKITDETTKAPLAGATVSIRGSRKAVTTDAGGNFSLKAPAGPVTLVITSIGFATKELVASASSGDLAITLSTSSSQLGEVVVTALGINRTAKSLVYATQTVKVSELTGVRDPNNVLNSLQGKVANAVITQGSGGPGSGARIVLRGNRSISQSSNALIVVDGVPITNGTNSAAGSDFGSVQRSDGASNINPDDIESVNILRGASAAALYGSQAGNGVIVITTKKGAKDKVTVNVNSGIAFESAWALPKVQNTYGQGNNMIADSSIGDSWGPKMTGQAFTDYLGKSTTYSAQPNNVKDFFRTGTSVNNSINVSGGTEKAQTYLSYTNNLIQGIVSRNGLNRHTFNLRLTNQVGKRFSTDAKITSIKQDITNKPHTDDENAPVIDIYQIPRNVSLAEAQHN